MDEKKTPTASSEGQSSEERKGSASKVKERKLRPFYLHQWLDVLDTDQKWLEAQVIKLYDGEKKMRIHYKGWKDRYDEDLSTDESSPDAERIALLHAHSAKPPHYPVFLDVGKALDVLDTQDKWMSGLIVNTDPEHDMVRVRYIGWSPKFDEWINVESNRFAPQYTFVAKPVFKPTLRRQASNNFNVGLDMERKFREDLMRDLKCIIEPQKEDGNCLFRSVSHQVYGVPDHHHIVRQKCMQYITSERFYFKNFIAEQFEQYVERMKLDGEWGDHVEIQAMSEIYNRPVHIYAYSSRPMKTFEGPNNKSQPMRLSYHFRSHYNSIIDPDKHHLNLLKSEPGELEDKHIARSRKGGGTGLNRHAARGAGDDEELRLALEMSRKTMGHAGGDDFERAIMASLQTETKSGGGAGGSGIPGEGDPVQEAIQRSLLEEAAKFSSERKTAEEQELERAIAESLGQAVDEKKAGSASSGPVDSKEGKLHSPSSRAAAGSGSSSSAGSGSTPAGSGGSSGSSGSSSAGSGSGGSGSGSVSSSAGASAQQKKDAVVRRCAEFGFAHGDILRAYDKVNSGPVDNISEDVLFNNALNYLMR